MVPVLNAVEIAMLLRYDDGTRTVEQAARCIRALVKDKGLPVLRRDIRRRLLFDRNAVLTWLSSEDTDADAA